MSAGFFLLFFLGAASQLHFLMVRNHRLIYSNFQTKLHTFVLMLILSSSFNSPSLSLVFVPRCTYREQSSTFLSYVLLG